ncbi:MAG: glycosyltransferase family 2 protein, partial [Thermoguttaceae bacterium]|nr:glycosyltransferase family 2 protein [Thermoguttaceae bacterium]
FTIEQGCRRILETHGRLGDPSPGPEGARPASAPWRRDAAALVRAAYFQAKTLPSSLGPRLRRCRLAHTLYYPAKSLLDRLRGRWSLAEIERRRRRIVERLDRAESDRHGSVRCDYELSPNARYRAAVAPAVSVVVTVYNYARFVAACLESVARSHVEGLPGPIETVIVDDASTDHSAEVAGQWLRREAVAGCLVRKATNTGLADARNLGLALARAPLVFILDADNLVYPRCLTKLARTMRHSGAAAAYGMIRRFDDRTGQGIDLVSWHAWDPARLVSAPYLDAMAMFDRQTLLDLGGYSTELVRYGWFGWEDYDLWLKLAQAGCDCAFCPEVVAEYRVHGASMVHITSHYKPRLVRYFREKFADLAARYPDGPRRFGWAR